MTDPRPAPRINALATAVPGQEINQQYIDWAAAQIEQDRSRKLFRRMSARSGIGQRFTVLGAESARFEPSSFYGRETMPGTGERMQIYAEQAPALALEAIADLPDLTGITHVVTASCTGFLAPGLDQIVTRKLDLDPGVERVAIGFMGCYAGVTALRTAAHIVRSDPSAKVLTIAVELCTLHLQQTQDLESLLAMSQFADGAAVAIISGEGEGLTLGQGISATLQESAPLMNWRVGDQGFVMHLSGAVAGRIANALDDPGLQRRIADMGAGANETAYAVHPGGRSILDAVERGLSLDDDALEDSRSVLADFGNMSSATILFVLERLMRKRPERGIALAFGPGLALEGLQFGWADA